MPLRAVLFVVCLAFGCAGPARPPRVAALPDDAPPDDAPPAPAYPPRFTRISADEIAAAERRFRARNPEPWTEVRIDEFSGLLYYARIAEPLPTAMPTTPTYDDDTMRARWRPFLERNADFLGLGAPGMVPIADNAYREIGFSQFWGRWSIATASVMWRDVGYESPSGRWTPATVHVNGHGWLANLPVPDELTDDELAAQWVGARGLLHIRYIAVPHPCDPAGRFDTCARQPVAAPPPAQEPYVLTRPDVVVQRVLQRCRPSDDVLELRIVAQLQDIVANRGLGCRTQAEHACQSGFVPDGPALPTRIDAVTGEPLEGLRCE